MAQTDFLESESLPGFDTSVGKVMLPILFVTRLVVLDIAEIEECVEIGKTIKGLPALVAILAVGYDEITTFQVVKHFRQATSTKACSLFYLATQKALSLRREQFDDNDIAVCTTEEGIVEFLEFVTQVSTPTEYQGIDILGQTEIGTQQAEIIMMVQR